MADLRRKSVEELRRLAREVLGEGASRLRTKKQLLAALGAGAPPPAPQAKAVRRAAARPAARTPRAGKAKAPKAAARAARAEAEGSEPAPAMPVGGGIDPEGYIVARVRGEEAARLAPRPLTEVAAGAGRPREMRPTVEAPPAPGWDELLGELPWSYGDDALVALPREPRTLFVYWDFAATTVSDAFAGMDGGRSQLWIFARGEGGGLERVRTIEFALESRGYYVHDLEPGRVYQAEVHVVDRQGRERRLGRPSNEMALPPLGPSPLVDDRFARIPWDLALSRWLREFRRGGPFPEDLRALLARLSDWSRFAGRAASPGAGGMGGRPASPSSPFGPRGGREGA